MHRSYEPLKPVTNRYLQQRWDQKNQQDHRRKVNSALPVVDNRGLTTPAHIQLKLKKLQLQDERLAAIDRDNRLLASKLAHIVCSRGLVDHHNHYHLRSLNADRKREELLLITRQNQSIYQRITSRQSEYRRQLWLAEWEKEERRRQDVSRFPRASSERQRTHRTVKFAAEKDGDASTSCSCRSTDRTDSGSI